MTRCRYCVAHKSYIEITVNLRTVLLPPFVAYGRVLWPCGTPAGRDIAVDFCA